MTGEAELVPREEADIKPTGRPRGSGKYTEVGKLVAYWVSSGDYRKEVLKIPAKNASQAIINMRTSTSFKRATADVEGMFSICKNRDNDAMIFVAKDKEDQ